MGTELSDPSSDLSQYLSKQIQSGGWKSKNPIRVEGADAETPESPAGVTELVLNLNDGGNLGAYHLTVTLTYTQNIPDAGDVDDEMGDDTDLDVSGSDSEGSQSSGEQESTGEPALLSESEESQAPIILTYSIHATIKCVRGDATDRDAQYYVIETTYPNAITITIPEGSGNE